MMDRWNDETMEHAGKGLNGMEKAGICWNRREYAGIG